VVSCVGWVYLRYLEWEVLAAVVRRGGAGGVCNAFSKKEIYEGLFFALGSFLYTRNRGI